jgi:hypothetical protein
MLGKPNNTAILFEQGNFELTPLWSKVSGIPVVGRN